MSNNRWKCVEFIGEGTYLISWQTTWTKQSAGRLSACILPVLSPIQSFVSIYWHRMYRPSITLELWKLWFSILRIIVYFQFPFSHATCTNFYRRIHVCQPWKYVTGRRSLCPLNLAGTLIFKTRHCIWISKIIVSTTMQSTLYEMQHRYCNCLLCTKGRSICLRGYDPFLWMMLVSHCNFLLHLLSKFKIYDMTILLSNGSKQIYNLVCWLLQPFATISVFVCLFVCLFGVFVPLENIPMDTSPLPMKGSKFWHMLGTHGHWAVRVL